ncbi:MAG: hypothetical protein RDU30_09930 [Desulfovibrionaceae bacterium]|nr:hypothetical protein [Desulfovibrionaceae bacterium]
MMPSQIFVRIASAIRDDPTVQAWCMEHFHRRPEVRIGFDPERTPDSERYPVVNVLRNTAARSNAVRRTEMNVLMGVGVHAPGEEVLDNGVIVINGELLIEDFRYLAEGAVCNARLGRVDPSSDVPEGVPLPYHLNWSALLISNIR